MEYFCTLVSWLLNLPVSQLVVHITGMTCSSCTNSIERMLLHLEGVKEASVVLTTEMGNFYTVSSYIYLNDTLNCDHVPFHFTLDQDV